MSGNSGSKPMEPLVAPISAHVCVCLCVCVSVCVCRVRISVYLRTIHAYPGLDTASFVQQFHGSLVAKSTRQNLATHAL